jgi:hypothetical protein
MNFFLYKQNPFYNYSMTYNVKVGNVDVKLFDIVKQYENSSANSSLVNYLNETSAYINGRSYTSYFSDSTDSNVIKVYNANKNSMVAKGTTGFQVSGTDIISTNTLAEYKVCTNTTESTVNIPTGCTRLNIIVVGGGGGGGGTDGNSNNRNWNSGGGGGGGGVSVHNGIEVGNLTTFKVKAGKGGTSAVQQSGNAGGTTYVKLDDTSYSATGGNGGSMGNEMGPDEGNGDYVHPTNGNGGLGSDNATHHSDGNAGGNNTYEYYGGNGGTINNGLSAAILPIKTTPGNGAENNKNGNSANHYGAGGGGSGGTNKSHSNDLEGGNGSQGIAFVFFRYD